LLIVILTGLPNSNLLRIIFVVGVRYYIGDTNVLSQPFLDKAPGVRIHDTLFFIHSFIFAEGPIFIVTLNVVLLSVVSLLLC